MSTTKVPNFLITPNPPSAEEIATALGTKLNTLENKTQYMSTQGSLIDIVCSK